VQVEASDSVATSTTSSTATTSTTDSMNKRNDIYEEEETVKDHLKNNEVAMEELGSEH
jgi:hypothetical protein